ncbi:methionyl-tRNA formyltransferase [Natronospora cellulosivora (SeqCode)]
MKIIFMGTPDFAVYSLESLAEAQEIEILAVVTQPDRPKGRGQKLRPTAVKKKALDLKIPVLQSENINSEEFLEKLRALSADAIVVVAFGQKLSEEILNMTKYGCINLHGSLLPEYRGASPIHQAIIDGKKVTGITTMYMAEGWDTGDMIYKKEVDLKNNDTVGSLHDKLADIGADLLVKTLIDIEKGIAPREEQDDSKATYASKIDKKTGRIDWSKTSEEIYNLVRGVNPWPTAHTYYQGKLLKVWKVEIDTQVDEDVEAGTILKADVNNGIVVKSGDASIKITRLQVSGRKKMDAKKFLNGYTIDIGEKLG